MISAGGQVVNRISPSDPQGDIEDGAAEFLAATAAHDKSANRVDSIVDSESER